MARIKYILKKSVKKSDRTTQATLYIRFTDGRKLDTSLDSYIAVNPNHWNDKEQALKTSVVMDEVLRTETDKKLADLKNYLLNEYSRISVEDATKEWFKTVIDKFHNPHLYQSDEAANKPPTLFEYIQTNFIDGIKERRGKKGDKLTKSTAVQYVIMFNHLKRFCNYKGREYDFADIDEQFGKDYVSFREIEFISKNTIGKELRFFKSIIRSADIKSTKLNIQIDSEYKGIKPAKEDTGNIALTDEELYDLSRMRLHNHPHLDRIRDQFVILCRTACRYSDLDKVGMLVENGLIKMRQEKTGNVVYIPIHADVKRLLDKYDGRLPKVIAVQSFNESMKLICSAIWRMRKETYTTIKTIGGEAVTITKPRYKWVSSHTGRRTFATNEVKAGTPIPVVMSITGHKTQESFMKYVKISQEDYAKQMLEIWNARQKGGVE